MDLPEQAAPSRQGWSFARLKESMPRGRALDEKTWRRRHRGIRILLVAQALGLLVFALLRGYPAYEAVAEGIAVTGFALLAGVDRIGRKAQMATATMGLMICAALLVHFSGGTIEAHFSFFVILSVIALYQDWTAFLLAVGFVALHHGVMGVLLPDSVYDHSAARSHPWTWAGIHAAFVLGASVANLVFWRVTEAAHAQAGETASRLSATLESTADGILVVNNADGKITSINRKFLEMWRMPEDVIASGDDDQAITFVLSQLIDPDQFLAKLRQLYAEPESESFDVLHFVDGRTFERFSQAQRVDGVAVGRVWSFRDVTERNKLDEMKNGFLSAVSHELRTPLTSVLGFAATMQQRGNLLTDEDREEMLARLTSNARKLQRLVSEILDLDRLGRGLLEPRRIPTDMAHLVRGVAEDADLPELRVAVDVEPITADIDSAKVERILENLIINASRHTPPGTQTWVRVSGEDDQLLIVVEDAGPGVPDDLKATIFESFKQGATSPHSPGVGIGLSLVSRFAELHGGRAWVEDREGGGASFRVLIPAKIEHIARTSSAGAAAAHHSGAPAA
jgi:signal transduction histidine kinase